MGSFNNGDNHAITATAPVKLYDHECEQQILSGIISDANCDTAFAEIDKAGGLSTNDFHNSTFGDVYAIAKKLYDAGERYDRNALHTKLKDAKFALPKSCPTIADFLTRLECENPSSFIKSQTARVKELAIKRHAVETLQLSIKAIHCDDSITAARLADAAKTTLYSGGKSGLIMRTMVDIADAKIEWLWRGYIPRGMISGVVGAPNAGKSFFVIDTAARVSTGNNFPDGGICESGDVIFADAENDPACILKPRLLAAGANLNRIHLIDAVIDAGKQSGFYLRDIDRLSIELKKYPQTKLLIIDPIGSYIGGKVDTYRDNETREALRPLAELAATFGVAVVLVCHTRKGGSTGNADDMIMASRAFSGLARATFHVVRDPADADIPENKCRRILAAEKMNIAPTPPSLAYWINPTGNDFPPCCEWESDAIHKTATEFLLDGKNENRGRHNDELQEAIEFLETELPTGETKKANDIFADADEAGISKRTLKRAKKEAGVESKKTTAGWEWTR